MICDVCKSKIKRDMTNKLNFYNIQPFWYIQEKIQLILMQAQDKRTNVSRYLNEEQVAILKNMLDEIELVIGKITPCI